jgi:hypothetical protein
MPMPVFYCPEVLFLIAAVSVNAGQFMHCQTRGFLFAEIFELPRSLTFIAEYCTVHCKKCYVR